MGCSAGMRNGLRRQIVIFSNGKVAAERQRKASVRTRHTRRSRIHARPPAALVAPCYEGKVEGSSGGSRRQGRCSVRVLLVTEGTYPFSQGGLANWCDMLVRDLPDVEFVVLGMASDPASTLCYELPRNVVQLVRLPLWGIREAIENQRHLGLGELIRRSARATEASVAAHFIPPFRTFLASLFLEDRTRDFAPALLQMRRFFLAYDFDATLRSRVLWQCFAEASEAPFVKAAALCGYPDAQVNLDEVSSSLSLLYHWLMPLGAQLPAADLTHAASAGLCGLIGTVAKLERGTPFLLTEHGVYLRERYLDEAGADDGLFRKLFRLRFARRLTELGYRYADRVAPGSRYNQRWEVAMGVPSDRVQVIYNGVDPSRFVPVSKAASAPATVVWLGRIDPLKDLFTLLEAAAIVRKTRPDILFRLHGTAPSGAEDYYQACLTLRSVLGLQETVRFEGHARSAAAAFNAGDVVVLSSISEGFPYSVVEAMLCAKPVVATAVGGVPEALAGCGIIVEPRNPSQMAAAILELMADPNRRAQLGHAARNKASQEYTLQQCSTAYRSLYRSLVHKRVAATVVAHAQEP